MTRAHWICRVMAQLDRWGDAPVALAAAFAAGVVLALAATGQL
jgi:hypothetical protein